MINMKRKTRPLPKNYIGPGIHVYDTTMTHSSGIKLFIPWEALKNRSEIRNYEELRFFMELLISEGWGKNES